MAQITTRQTAGIGATVNNAPLSNAQIDTNFIRLNEGIAIARANVNITGGGTISVDSSYNVSWSQRFIVISNGRGTSTATNGYWDITVPAASTVITGVGGAGNKTVVAAGIPLAAWDALYYILPLTQSNGSLAANFRIASYTADLDIPSNWILICIRNGDNGIVYFTHGINLSANDSTVGYETSANTANTLVARDGSGNFSAGTITAALSGNALTASTWQTARTLTIGATGKSVNGSANVSWSLGEIQAEYQQPLNTLRNNLGDPTVREMALFHGQFNNKFRFIAPTTQEESTDGIVWTASTRATADQLADMMIGEGQGTSFSAIPSATVGVYGAYRLTWDVVGQTGYVFLNNLYVYNSTNGNNVTVLIEAFHNTNGWQAITGPHTFNNWPGHTTVPHSTIPYSASASQYSRVRVTFTTTHNTNTNAFTLYGIEWFGGYPAGKRNAESYDRNKNVYFPNGIFSNGNAVLNAGNYNTYSPTLTGTGASGTWGISVTGTSANVTGTVAIANGGTGQTTVQAAINVLAGAVTSGQYLRGNGTNVVMSAIQAADVPTLNQNTTGTASNVTGTVAIANGGTGATTNTAARTNLGASTVGSNLFTLTNPSAITFLRVNADNTVSALDAATFRTAIGAGTSSTVGTVTSVGGTGTVSGLSLSGTVTSSGNLTLSGTLSVTASNFASQTANTVLAAPNGAPGVPTFRALVAADIPTLNQNTTGTAANVTGTVAIANGGTGATTNTAARTNLGATTVGSNLFTLTNPSAITFLRVNADNTVSALDAATFRTAIGAGTSSTVGTVTSVGGTGTVSGISLSGTVTSTGSLTLSGTLAVTASNFSSQTANTFLAAPNGAAGVPTFRAIVAADIPTLNQNTTGNAGSVTNGVYTNGSYADPSWITSLSETKVLPSQTGHSGKFLTTNGTSTSWGTAASTGKAIAMAIVFGG